MRFVLSFAAGALACGLLAVSAQAAAPTIEGVSAKSITSRRATLEATIDPNGLETTYEIWVSYAACQNTPPGDAACLAIVTERWGEGQISAGSVGQVVSITHRHLESDYLYSYWVVANNSGGEKRSVSQEFKVLQAPVVDSESASGITSSDGTLEAQINPKGQAVYYQFQLVANASEYPSELECPQRLLPVACVGSSSHEGVLPVKYLPAGATDQDVSLDLKQAGVTLKPNTTYHYRVLVAPFVQTEDTVEWEGPPADGADQTFTTQPGPPPSVESVSLSHLTPTDATLEAQTNTEGLETIYEFKLWASPCSSHASGCEDLIRVPLPSGKLLGSFIAQSVSLDLNSAGVTLVPGGEYGYSFIATSAAGSVEGKWQTFDAPEEAAVPLKNSNPGGATTTLTAGSVAGSQTLDPSLTLMTADSAVPDLMPDKVVAKGHAKVKRSVKHKKPKRHKSKAAKHKSHKAGKH